MPADARQERVVVGFHVGTPTASLALCTLADARSLAVIEFHEERRLHRYLTRALGHLLDVGGVEPEQIAAIGVGRGPGAFTGLRVGLSAIAGLRQVWSVPCYGMSSLEALALGLSEEERPVLALMDARKDQLYVGLYGPQQDGRRPPIEQDACINKGQLTTWLDKLGPGVICGRGAQAWAELSLAHCHPDARVITDPMAAPAGPAIARMAQACFNSGEPGQQDALAPVYLRSAVA